MKSKIFLMLLGFAFITSSCGKDDSCNENDLSQAIVGTWEVSALGINAGEVEFLSDGTLIDPNDLLGGGSLGEADLDEKSYTVDANETITVRAEKGEQFLDFEWPVKGFDCDQVTLDLLIADATLSRK